MLQKHVLVVGLLRGIGSVDIDFTSEDPGKSWPVLNMWDACSNTGLQEPGI